MMADNTQPLIPQLEEEITEIRWFKPDNLTEIYSNTYPLIRDLTDSCLKI